MISSKNIRFHAPSNTYIIPKNSVIDQNTAIKGNVIVGQGTHFWKNVKVDGNIQFGKGCAVEGNVKADQIIVGSRSKIKGKITADGDVSLFQNAFAESVESGGNITIMPGCVVGYANGSTLQIIGKAEIKKIGAITKVTVRADTVAELPEEPKDSENLEELEFAVNTPIHISSENEMQNISENLVFENNKKDEMESSSEELYNKEFVSESNAIENPTVTPTFQVENTIEQNETVIEKDNESENSGVEIIDETGEKDENSPKSFSFSEFSSVPSNHPVDIPTDESEEVEIIDGIDESESNENFVSKTIETPFGTIVVGEKTISKTPARSLSASKNQSETDNTVNKNDDGTFASVMEVSKEEQKADYEVEIRSKTRTPPSKVEFRWPSFEAKPTRKTGLRAAAERQEKENLFAQISQSPVKMSATEDIQYEEMEIRSAPKQKEFFAKPENNTVRKANQKIVFEEIGKSESVKQSPSAKQSQSMKQTEKQMAAEEIIRRQTKTEIKIETLSIEPIGAENLPENKSEKKERNIAEAERSKTWYEERYQEIKPRKKDYPPYI